MGMKSMKGERSEAFGDFTKRAENTDSQPLFTYLYYWSLSQAGPCILVRVRVVRSNGGLSPLAWDSKSEVDSFRIAVLAPVHKQSMMYP